jgi:fatty acid desaturase
MSELEPSRSRLPRRSREERAYRLVVASGVFGAVAVVGLVLAVLGVVGGWLPFVAAVIAAICGLMFRRTVSS